MRKRIFSGLFVILFSMGLLSGCTEGNTPTLPALPTGLPDLSEIPGLPASPEELPGLLDELNLPDLREIGIELPQLDDLPLLQVEDGTAILRGPAEQRIQLGQRIPGTDIALVAIDGTDAEFRIDGLRSVRTVGDSLHFDGDWPGIDGVQYNLRLRIYRIGSTNVRAAGVHQLRIQNVQPVARDIDTFGSAMRFPVVESAAVGETIRGTSFTYLGQTERGAEIGGLPAGEFPYFKTGDRIRWQGMLRPDIPIAYNVRVAWYNADTIRIGGVARVYLPGL